MARARTKMDGPLAEAVCKFPCKRWNADNKGAIQAYNARIEREGLPLEKYRNFAEGACAKRKQG
jgi:antitoxin CcdA